MSRIKVSPKEPTADKALDRAQDNINRTLASIVSKPTVDSQLVTVALQNTTSAQTITIPHNLGRPSAGAHVVGTTGPLITAQGNHKPVSTTQTTLQLQTTGGSGSATIAVF